VRTLSRLSLKLQRFEVAATLGLCLAATAAALVVRGALQSLAATQDCFVEWFTAATPPGTGSCGPQVQEFFAVDNAQAAPVLLATALLPWIAGLMLGVPAVGRELEGRTGSVAWSLAGSRLKWLAVRVVPIAATLVGALAIVAAAADALLAARQPWVTPGQSFLEPVAHGVLLVERGIVAYLIGLLVGAVMGRVLPALIVTGLVLALLFVGGEVLRGSWLQSQARTFATTEAPTPLDTPGAAVFGSASRASDGTILSDEDALAMAPDGVDPSEWLAANFENVYLLVPGSKYPEWVQLESVGLTAVALAALVLTASIVRRRRPY
jgi:hypothetical protein